MTLREQAHALIDTLSEAELKALVQHLGNERTTALIEPSRLDRAGQQRRDQREKELADWKEENRAEIEQR